MNRGWALTLARRRGRNDGQDLAERRTEAFKWAWGSLQGWGEYKNDGNWQAWNYSERIVKAQELAWWAVNQPLWSAPRRKRWPAAEQVR